MAKIGKFNKVGDEFHGEIVTLSVQHSDVRIVPDKLRAQMDQQNSPLSHLVFAGRAELGAGWEKDDSKIGLKLDDPSFYAPIYPILTEGDEGFNLVWVRSGR